MQVQRNRALECPGWRGWGEGGGLTGWRSGRAGEQGSWGWQCCFVWGRACSVTIGCGLG